MDYIFSWSEHNWTTVIQTNKEKCFNSSQTFFWDFIDHFESFSVRVSRTVISAQTERERKTVMTSGETPGLLITEKYRESRKCHIFLINYSLL